MPFFICCVQASAVPESMLAPFSLPQLGWEIVQDLTINITAGDLPTTIICAQSQLIRVEPLLSLLLGESGCDSNQIDGLAGKSEL